MRGLVGKATVITGSGRRIGKKTAERFAEEGSKVIAANVGVESIKETVRKIEKSGGHAKGVKLDITNLR